MLRTDVMDESKNAGFSTGQPLVEVNPNYQEINVQEALSKSRFLFSIPIRNWFKSVRRTAG